MIESFPDWVLDAVKDLDAISTEAEVARFFKKHPKTIYRWREVGKIRGIRTDTEGSGTWRYPRLEIIRCMLRLAEGGPLSES